MVSPPFSSTSPDTLHFTAYCVHVAHGHATRSQPMRYQLDNYDRLLMARDERLQASKK